MASSLLFGFLTQIPLTILSIMLFQAFLDHQHASRHSKHHDSLLAAIACLSAKLDQKQLNEKNHQLEIKSKLKILQSDIGTIRCSLRVRPTENELFINLHQHVIREVRELRSKIKSATLLPSVLPVASPPVLPVVSRVAPPPAAPTTPAAAPPPPTAPATTSPPSNGVPPQQSIPAPDPSGVLTLSDSEEDEEDDDIFAPGRNYNASEPWE